MPVEQTTFKTATFGGFAKEDVVAYIEKTANEHKAAQEQLRRANIELSAQLQQAQKALTEAQSRLLLAEKERDVLRPDAQAYQHFIKRLGSIECQARERAATLEQEAYVRLSLALEALQAQYNTLSATMETSTQFALAELRKVEVNLTQLPRSMDQLGSELAGVMQQVESVQNIDPST